MKAMGNFPENLRENSTIGYLLLNYFLKQAGRI
jgi:hypothetical protein